MTCQIFDYLGNEPSYEATEQVALTIVNSGIPSIQLIHVWISITMQLCDSHQRWFCAYSVLAMTIPIRPAWQTAIVADFEFGQVCPSTCPGSPILHINYCKIYGPMLLPALME